MPTIKSQLKKSLIEFCVLIIISGGDVYASDILEGLKNSNLLVVEGTLYPLLSRLRREELVAYRWEESASGPPRKYYNLTKSGEERLAIFQETWSELSDSINLLLKTHAKGN
jgi:PadR family transcriptional regulator, regulatory protein PadR